MHFFFIPDAKQIDVINDDLEISESEDEEQSRGDKSEKLEKQNNDGTVQDDGLWF